MILDSSMSRGFQDLIGYDVGYERHDAEVCVKFQESVDCDFPSHPSELEHGNIALRSLLLYRIEGATLPIRRTKHTDDVLASIGQRRQNVFAKCGLPYYGDSQVVSHICL